MANGGELDGFLRRHRLIGIDTALFIYQIEENEEFSEASNQVFSWLEKEPDAGAVTSTVTMLEVLLQPYRLSDLGRVDSFYALLSTCPRLRWAAPTLDIADKAAQIRAERNLKTPDAIQAATALAFNATGFVANDPVFKRVSGFEVLILKDLEAAGS